MPLVQDLKGRLSVISEEIKAFSQTNKNMMSKLQEQLNSAMSKLERAALHSQPAVHEVLLTAQDLRKVRPKTSSTCRPGIWHNRASSRQTHENKSAKYDIFSGLAFDSKSLDALALESPSSLHGIASRNAAFCESVPENLNWDEFQGSIAVQIKQDAPETKHRTLRRTRSGGSVYESPMRRLPSLSGSAASPTRVESPGRMWSDARPGNCDIHFARVGSTSSMRPDARSGNSSINLSLIQDCKKLVKNVEMLASNDDNVDGFLNSDDEMELYAEVDRMCAAHEENEDKQVRWDIVAGQLINRTSLHIGNLESSWELLYRLLRSVADEEEANQADPRISMENVAQALSCIRAQTKLLDLDQVLEEVHSGQKNLLWAVPREKQDVQGEKVHVMNLLSCSPSFRKAVLNMKIDENLCILMVCFFGGQTSWRPEMELFIS
jgi:hypothetical protein